MVLSYDPLALLTTVFDCFYGARRVHIETTSLPEFESHSDRHYFSLRQCCE